MESPTERRFQDVVESLGAMVWEADAQSLRVSFVSGEVEQLLGYPLDEWLSSPAIWRRIIHPDDYERVRAAWATATREGQDRALECRAVATDGRIVCLRGTVRGVRDAVGRTHRLRGILLDVTERTRAREALEQSEARYRALFEESRDAVYVTTLEGAFVDINEAALDLLGHTRDEIIGLNAAAFYLDPDDRARFQHEIEAHGSVRDFEVRLRNRDGAALDCLLTSTVRRGGDGSIVGYHGIIHDITGRKQVEEGLRRSEGHFRSLIENALDTITVLDGEGVILYESPSVERVLGYKPYTLVGQSVFGMVHPDDLGRVADTFGELIERAGVVRTVSLRFRHRDGSWRNLEATGRNLLDDPVVAGIVVNARDVSERRQLEEQLQQAGKMEAIGRLAGGVAHDFNNLLTAIRGHAQLLLEDLPVTDPMRAELKEIGKAATRATALTRQLLAFSRKQLLRPRVLALNGVVSEMESMLRRLIGEDVLLECLLQDGLGRVKVDPSQIEQVVLNLALNARDAMPEGGRLTITTADAVIEAAEVHGLGYTVDPGEYVRLSMADTGTGIEPSTQAHIFEPFFTTKEQGTGLGLSTVYGIVRQTGGHIRVESQLGRGTEFEIYLPRVEGEEEPKPDVPAGVAPSGTEAILLVEDEETVRSLADRVLRRSGYDVLGAANGSEALAVCKEHGGPIDLVLTDVVMPEMSGHALVEQLLRLRPTLRVIFMSGYSEDMIVHQGVLERANAFLPKPFTPRTLARLVRDVLDRPPQG